MRLVMPDLIRHPCRWSGVLRAPPWIAGQARNDIDIDLPKAHKLSIAINSFGVNENSFPDGSGSSPQ
jgi:hypothetical protein